jgi:hypothetical protein
MELDLGLATELNTEEGGSSLSSSSSRTTGTDGRLEAREAKGAVGGAYLEQEGVGGGACGCGCAAQAQRRVEARRVGPELLVRSGTPAASELEKEPPPKCVVACAQGSEVTLQLLGLRSGAAILDGDLVQV